jgi:hypothetical protein
MNMGCGNGRWGTLVAGAALGLLVSACGNSPEKVCNHIAELAKKPSEHMQDKQDAFIKNKGKCVTRLTALKESNEMAYDSLAECALQSDSWLFAVDLCPEEAGLELDMIDL